MHAKAAGLRHEEVAIDARNCAVVAEGGYFFHSRAASSRAKAI